MKLLLSERKLWFPCFNRNRFIRLSSCLYPHSAGPLLGHSWASPRRASGGHWAAPGLLLGCLGVSWGLLGLPGASWGCSWTASGRPPACCSWRLWLLLSAPGCSWRLVAAPGRLWPSWPLACVFLAAAAGLLAASGFAISFRDKYHYQVRMRTRMYKSMHLCIT